MWHVQVDNLIARFRQVAFLVCQSPIPDCSEKSSRRARSDFPDTAAPKYLLLLRVSRDESNDEVVCNIVDCRVVEYRMPSRQFCSHAECAAL